MAKTRKPVDPEKREPSRSQLEKLYGFMTAIRKQEPWKKLWDTDFVCVDLPAAGRPADGKPEPALCSVMGRNEECYGIAVYPGEKSIAGLYRMLEDVNGAQFGSLEYTDCITCYFGGRDELEDEERERIKEMGLAFRGKNNWPYFRRSKPGRLPWHISAKDAEILETVLEQFAAAYTDWLGNDGFTVNFDEREAIHRQYLPETDSWHTMTSRVPAVRMIADAYIIDDEEFFAPLKTKQYNGNRLEADVLYLPMLAGGTGREAPVIPRMAVLIDADSGMIVAQRVLEPDDENADIMTDLFGEFIDVFGRPETLYFRNMWAGYLYRYFCEKAGINMVCDEGVPHIDGFVEAMLEEFGAQ